MDADTLVVDADHFATVRANYERLRSLGHDDDLASLTAAIQAWIGRCTSQLRRCERIPEDKLSISIGFPDDQDLIVHDALLPEWEKFAAALSSTPSSDKGYIELRLGGLQLGGELRGIFLKAIRSAPLRTMLLKNNGSGREAVAFLANILEGNSTLESVFIEQNPIESEQDAIMLATSVTNHPTLDLLSLPTCRLGENDAVMTAILPIVDSLNTLNLSQNNIGTTGAKLLAACLGKNPSMKFLFLNDNSLGDGDASLFALSLEKNSNLQNLFVKGNQFTRHGVRTLTRAVLNLNSLNSLHDSNHTCFIDAGDGNLRKFNRYEDRKANRAQKILGAIEPDDGTYSNISCINHVPIELIPRVLCVFQTMTSPRRGLNSVYLLMRLWNMPFLYTSSIGFEPRRSERIRKRKVEELCS